MTAPNKRKRRKDGRGEENPARNIVSGGNKAPHVRLTIALLNSPAYIDLNSHARVVLTAMLSIFAGFRNGDFAISREQIMKRTKGINKEAIARAIADLVEHGFLEVTNDYDRRRGQARRYRFTFYSTTEGEGADVRQVPATDDFLYWKPGALPKRARRNIDDEARERINKARASGLTVGPLTEKKVGQAVGPLFGKADPRVGHFGIFGMCAKGPLFSSYPQNFVASAANNGFKSGPTAGHLITITSGSGQTADQTTAQCDTPVADQSGDQSGHPKKIGPTGKRTKASAHGKP